jgi:malonate transporter
VLQILLVTFPFFALVLCGYLAARRRMLPLDAIPGLNGFVLFFALPCMLYRFGANTPLAQLLDAELFVTYLFCALVMVGFVVAVTLNRRIGWNDAAFGALVAAFPNTGFMGVPLLVALLGPAAAGPAIVTILVDLVITSSLCIALSRLDGATGAEGGGNSRRMSPREAAKNALKGVATNPMPWAIALGGFSSALQIELPKPVLQTVGLLADAASPVALFTIGAVLARSQMMTSDAGLKQTLPQPGQLAPLRDYVPVALFKLLLHPVLVLLVGIAAVQIGLQISPFALKVMVLVAALPSASNVSLLAERFGADTGRIARIILVSTALAFLTFSGAVSVLR